MSHIFQTIFLEKLLKQKFSPFFLLFLTKSVGYSRGICYPNLTKNIEYDYHGPYMLHAKSGPVDF